MVSVHTDSLLLVTAAPKTQQNPQTWLALSSRTFRVQLHSAESIPAPLHVADVTTLSSCHPSVTSFARYVSCQGQVQMRWPSHDSCNSLNFHHLSPSHIME